MTKLIRPRGAPAKAWCKLDGRESEIYKALTEEGETLTSLAKRLGVSRGTLTKFVRERLEGGEDAANEVKQEK